MEGRERAAGAGQTDGCSSASAVGCDKNQRVTVKPVDLCNVDDGDRSADEENETNTQQNADAIWKFVPSPPVPLRDQIEKDKEDESLRRWKEQLLGCVESDLDGKKTEPEVIFHSVGIISDDTVEISTPIPVDESKRNCALFTLKEGSEYQLKLAFTVLHNIVAGLTYTNTVWKGGHQVDQSKGMLGAFAPRREPYVHTLDTETAPSGVLARGMYSAMLKVED